MSEDFEREERAFAEALHASVPVETFRPLDADAIKGAARPVGSGRSRWIRTLAAAAVLVVTVGVGAALLPRSGGSVTAEPAAGYGAGGSVPEAATDRGSAANSAEVGEWSVVAAAPPLSPRSNAAGAWLNGEFYLVGGQTDAPCPPNADCMAPSQLLKDGAAYNQLTNTWRRIADSPLRGPAGRGGRAVVLPERLRQGKCHPRLRHGFGCVVAAAETIRRWRPGRPRWAVGRRGLEHGGGRDL